MDNWIDLSLPVARTLKAHPEVKELLIDLGFKPLGNPVTMFYIPGFFPLVPGIGVYRTAFYYINDNPAQASYYMVQSALIAGAIALSIFLVDSCLEIYHHLRNQAKAKRKEQSHG